MPESHVVHKVMQPLLQALQQLHAQVQQTSVIHAKRDVLHIPLCDMDDWQQP
jgi:hypothetical protein